MCSWCWGFSPTLEKLEASYDIPVRTLVGGLRPGPAAQPLDERMSEFLAHHWEQVATRSGQPFDTAALERQNWIYDTELPCTAVVTMRRLNPGQTLRFFSRIQRAFYVENVDVTDPFTYPRLLDGFNVDSDAFMKLLMSQDAKLDAWRDFDEAKQLTVTGFPTLLLRTPEQHLVVTRGYLPWENLQPTLDAWFQQQFGAEVAAELVCSIDGPC